MRVGVLTGGGDCPGLNAVIRAVVRTGVAEHDMEFIARIARTVTVLHEGSVLAEGPMDVVQADPRVIEVYLGR